MILDIKIAQYDLFSMTQGDLLALENVEGSHEVHALEMLPRGTHHHGNTCFL